MVSGNGGGGPAVYCLNLRCITPVRETGNGKIIVANIISAINALFNIVLPANVNTMCD